MVPGPLMLDLQSVELSEDERELLLHPAVGGVIFFSRNFRSRTQLGELCSDIRDLRPQLLLAVDQEGGRVQRLRDGYTEFPPMARLGQLLSRAPEEGASLLRDAGWLLAAEVIASGLDFSFAPVLDLDDDHCSVIADRSFSMDPLLATQAARLFIAGMHEAGMAATGKHFPGHGGVSADSHLETPTDHRTLEQLRQRDLIPFCHLGGELDGIMPAHIIFPQVDGQCVGFSQPWLQGILRQQLGFEGVIFSDDLSMKGADQAGGYKEKARAALDAGCDMILVCNNPSGVLEVLNFLEAEPYSPSPRLETMRARKPWRWDALETDARRLQTRARLAQLNAD